MRPEAQKALAALIHEHGKAIVRMPSSCQMFMSLRLAPFPEERELLIQALRLGIPDRILAEAGTPDYEVKLAALAGDLAVATGVAPGEAQAAVLPWTEALDRHLDYKKQPEEDRLYPPEEAPPDPGKEQAVQVVMSLIAAAGGFLGTALGSGAVLIVLLITDAAVGDGGPTRDDLG